MEARKQWADSFNVLTEMAVRLEFSKLLLFLGGDVDVESKRMKKVKPYKY